MTGVVALSLARNAPGGYVVCARQDCGGKGLLRRWGLETNSHTP